VDGRPLSSIDPTGEFGVIGAAIGFGTELGLQLIMNGGRLDCVDWVDVGISTLVGIAGPGLFNTGKTLFKSTGALKNLSEQASRARTANRQGKVLGRMQKHQTEISDAVVVQGGFQITKGIGKTVTPDPNDGKCGKGCK
jgi:hypothetical protein